jgi:nucleoside-diphosphate-sugar epimerase
MNTVLVTGAAGFIGRSVVKMLVERGYHVIGLDNFRFSNWEQIYRHQGVEWIEGDTRDQILVAGVMKKVDHVIHLAAPSSFIMHEEDDVEASSFTLVGYKTVMECLRKRGLKKIVWASTSAVYEGNEVPYHESMTLNPPDSKAGCKHFCEMEAQRYQDRYGITSVALRPFSVYGVGEHTKLGYANVTSLFTWALMGGQKLVVWGDGKQTRDFIYVEDVARAFIDAMEKDDLPTCALNVGFGIEHTFNEVIQIAGEHLGVSPNVIYTPTPIQIYAHRLWADMTLAKRMLGFQPRITLEQGIERIIEATKALPAEVRKKLDLGMQQLYFKKLQAV